MNDERRVHGIHAPAPRATAWAALLTACVASVFFLSLLLIWSLIF